MSTATIDQAAPPAAPAPPALPDLTGSWFFGPNDGVTIPLSGGHSMVIYPEIPVGLGAQAGVAVDKADPNAALETFRIHWLAAHLVSWTLPGPELRDDYGQRVEIVGKLGASHLDRMHDAFNSYLEAHQIPTIPIVPVPLLSPFETWFAAGDDCYTLALPGNHSIRIKSELSALDRARLIAAGDNRSSGIRKVVAYTAQWSMTYPSGKIVPLGADSVSALPTSRFQILLRTIEAYEKELAAREANPIGTGLSIKPSESVN